MPYLETINMDEAEEVGIFDELMKGWQNDGGEVYDILSNII
jgi:hypothetical protein